MSLEKDVVGRIDAEWIAQEAYKLVDIPSVTLEEKVACDDGRVPLGTHEEPGQSNAVKRRGLQY